MQAIIRDARSGIGRDFNGGQRQVNTQNLKGGLPETDCVEGNRLDVNFKGLWTQWLALTGLWLDQIRLDSMTRTS